MLKYRGALAFRISILLLLILVSFYLFFHSSFFSIDSISVSGLEQVSEEEILALSGLTTACNIFKINDEISARSIQIHPMIKKAEIKRHYPRKLEIVVEERKTWAILPYNDIFLCIDKDGVCIDKVNNILIYNYPIITLDKVPERVNLGQAVNSKGIKMLRTVWEALSDIDRANISEYHYSSEKSITIYTMKGIEVRFGDLDRKDEKVMMFAQISEIEKDMEEKGQEVLEYVDIRFKGQPVFKTRM